MSDYETDILLWSEPRGELLRRRAAGEVINEAELDWPNIAEEIEDRGTQSTACCRVAPGPGAAAYA
jgi:Domain of unknown function DUF29